MGRWHSEVTTQLITDSMTQPLHLVRWRRLLALCIRQHLCVLSLCVIIGYGCAPTHRQGVQLKPAREHYTLALQYLSVGAGEKAVKELHEAVKIEPTNAEFHNLLAFAYHYEGRYEFALTHYRKALELAPGYAEAHVNLAALYLDLARWDDAVTQGREALKITTYQSPEKAYNNIGLAYMGKGDLISARRAFRDALAFHDNFPEAHRNLGTLYFQQGQVEEAMREYREALRLRPNYAEALHDLGVAYLERGRQAEAVAQFQRVIQLDPESELAEKAKLHLGMLQ
ncbi:MAG TPA: tetratricopeptide repeat protein [Candidatus Tectomicrobia bacterium]|nr:tetratricopeptide repeat protein [Candidatus Tectomicrobia bacterium]